jgi:hypothetical protein
MNRTQRLTQLAQITLCGALASACITAPPMIIADRKTALEEQASGSFPALTGELQQAGVSGRPVPYTRGQLEGAGVPVGKGDEQLAQEEASTEADLLDQLLLRRCIGEKLDGSLDETPATCTEPIAAGRQARLLERENRRRFQIWRTLAAKAPAGKQPSMEEVRRSWRKAHLGEVICGGQVQLEGGAWETKKC